MEPEELEKIRQANQLTIESAQANVKQTWEDIFLRLKVKDQEAPLEHGFKDGKPIGVRDPTNPISTFCLYIYQL